MEDVPRQHAEIMAWAQSQSRSLSDPTSSESCRSRVVPSHGVSFTAVRQARKLTQKRAFLAAGLATVVVPASEHSVMSVNLPTTHVRGLSGAIMHKNSEVANKLRELSDGVEAHGKDKDHTQSGHAIDSHEGPATAAAMMDLKSTIDIVEKELKFLLSGHHHKEHAVEAASGQQGDTLDDDEEDGRAQLLQRLQIYRYKRRISPPALPLLPLSSMEDFELPEVAERPNDKIERNLRSSRLGFYRTRHSRAKLFNQRTSSRSKLAQQHRAKASEILHEKALQRISNYEARCRSIVEQEAKRSVVLKAKSPGSNPSRRSATELVMNVESTSHSIGTVST